MSHEDSRHREVAPPVAPRACPRPRRGISSPIHPARCSVSGTRFLCSEGVRVGIHALAKPCSADKPHVCPTFPDVTAHLSSGDVVTRKRTASVSHQPRPCGHGGVHRYGETTFQFEPQTPHLSFYSVLRSSNRTDALAAEPWRRLNLELNAVRTCPLWDPVCQYIQRNLGGHLHDCLHIGHPFDERSAERREVRILVGCRGQRRAHWFLCRHPGWCRRLRSLELWRLDTVHWSLEMQPCTTFSHHAPGTLVREILPLRYRLVLHVVGRVPQARLRVASEVPARPLRGRDETKAQLSCPTLAHRTSSVAFACHRRCRRPRGHLHQEAVPVVEICSTRPQVHTLLGRAAFLECPLPPALVLAGWALPPLHVHWRYQRLWGRIFRVSDDLGAGLLERERAKVLPFTCTDTYHSPPPVWRSTHEPSSLNFISAPFLVSFPTLRRDLLTSLSTNGV